MKDSNPNKQQIIVFADFFYPAFLAGGQVKSVMNLIFNFSDKYDFYVVTRNHDLGSKNEFDLPTNQWLKYENYSVYYANENFLSYILLIFSLIRKDLSLFYFNSFFSFKFTFIPIAILLLALRFNKKILLAPRGELFANAISYKRVKKTMYLFFVKKIILKFKNFSFHASTIFEREAIKSVFNTKKFLISIASDIPDYPKNFSEANNVTLEKEFDLRIVFYSRISPIKNLEFVLDCINSIQKVRILLRIYGPIEDKSYWDFCKKKISSIKQHKIEYLGFVQKDAISSIFHEADLLFLPSRSENFGHVILEALSFSCPVLISSQTPWTNISDAGAGWCFSLDRPSHFVVALEEYAIATPQIRQKMRSNARGYFEKVFDDSIQANRLMLLEISK